MRFLSFRFFLPLTLIMAANMAQAQTDSDQSADISHGVYFGIGVLGLDEDEAFAQGVDDSATVLDAGYYATVGRHFAFIAGLSVPLIDDEDPFSQLVEDEWDNDVSWEESSIDAWSLLLEASARYPLNNTVSIGGAVGLRTLEASREITYCRNCRSEDIDLDGGTYIRPYVNVDTGMFSFEVSYTSFMSGDFTDGVLTNFIWSF